MQDYAEKCSRIQENARQCMIMHDNVEQFTAMHDSAKTIEEQCRKFQDSARRRGICKALHPA
jgi:hypothetical protein